MFVGSGAPTRQEPRHPRPLRRRDNIHIGIEWLESVALRPHRRDRRARAHHRRRQHGHGLLPHVTRLGGTDVRSSAASRASTSRRRRGSSRTPRKRSVEILENHAPKRFVVENGKLVGMEFERFALDRETNGKHKQREARHRHPAVRRRHPRHRPGERVPLDRARHRHRVRQDDMPVVDKPTLQSHARRRVLRRRRGVGPGEHHLGGRARPPGGDLDPQPLPGRRARPSVRRRGMNLVERKMGMHAWSYSQRLHARGARQDAARRSRQALQEARRSRSSSASPPSRRRGSRALPQLRHPDRLHRQAVHRVRRLHRRLPGELPDDHARTTTSRRCARSLPAPAANPKQALFVSAAAAADRARDGEGRRRVPALRPVRRALPDARLGHGQVRAVPSTRR